MSETNELPPADRPSAAAEISNLCVQLMHAYTGRGPRRARTRIDTDLVSVVLHDLLTKGEKSLIDDGRVQLVIEMRRALQRTMRPEFVAGVERVTGRKVIAFLSDNHIDPDLAVENFILAPRS